MARHELTNFHRRLLIGVLHVVQHPVRLLVISGLLVVICVSLAWWKLDISTDQDQLFSSNVPFFHDYIEFTKTFPENQASYVIIEAKDPAHPPPVPRWTACADAIEARLRRETRYVKVVDSHVPIADLGNQGLLFDDPGELKKDFADAVKMIPLARLWAESPNILSSMLGSSPLERFISGVGLQPPDSETAQFVRLLADGWTKAIQNDHPITLGNQVPDLTQLGASDPGRIGYYYVQDDQNPNNHLLLVRVFENDDYSSMGGLADVINGIRTATADAAKDFPEFNVALTGRPALEADEMVTTDRDSRRSEICALIAVFIGLVLLLRSFWLAVTAEIALLVGIGWTFGWATVTIGQLNLLSMVFLIALIGIGMDYLIQVLTRYRREAAKHSNPCVIWAGVFKYVAAPINTACLGAAGAFFVSIFTNFRGAAELGIIASGGLLLCLIAGYVVIPALLTLFPAKVPPVERDQLPFAADQGSPRPSHHWWLALPALWAALLLAGVPFARRAHFDPSLLNMQAQNLQSVQLVRKLQTWSAVELSTDLDILRKARGVVQHLPTVASTDSILGAYDNYDWLKQHEKQMPEIKWSQPQAVNAEDLPQLASKAHSLAQRWRDVIYKNTPPGTAADFESAAKSLDDFAEAITTATGATAAGDNTATAPTTTTSTASSHAAERLSQWEVVFAAHLKDLLAPFHPPPPDIAKLPKTLRDHYVGQDGRFALYINPSQDLWLQSNLQRFVHDVEGAVRAVPNAPPPTGIAINVYHSTSSIERSFYHATAYALALIFVLVLIDLRNIPQTVLAISVLAMGLPMLVALMGLLNINWNFANFFALPILIGAGHEYGVFMVHRYNEAISDPRRRWERWDVSDRALLLCAFVTCASFGFFWALGHHEGLKSLGLVMAMGVGCIYLATLCMLRPMLLWKLARRQLQPYRPGFEVVPPSDRTMTTGVFPPASARYNASNDSGD
jgi:predicted RND superfamily exporter protein